MTGRVRYIRLPWKKRFRSIPDFIEDKLSKTSGNIKVSATKDIPVKSILDGLYSHLGIVIENNVAKVLYNEIIPSVNTGYTSKINLHGRTTILKELPKIVKTYCVEVPNFGDPARGYHDLCRDREVWQKKFHPPQEQIISIEMIEDANNEDSIRFIFTIKPSLIRDSGNFENDLLFSLNLLQENTGVTNIFDSEATFEEITATLDLDWEILPPGTRDEIVNFLSKRFKNLDADVIALIQDRYDFLQSLDPIGYIFDASGMGRYFGAQFNENLVAFENIRYGNAMYIMYENWSDLSRLSRIELLKREEEDFDRIVHRTNWREKARKIIEGRK